MGAAILMSHDQSCCSFEWVLEMHLCISYWYLSAYFWSKPSAFQL